LRYKHYEWGTRLRSVLISGVQLHFSSFAFRFLKSFWHFFGFRFLKSVSAHH